MPASWVYPGTAKTYELGLIAQNPHVACEGEIHACSDRRSLDCRDRRNWQPDKSAKEAVYLAERCIRALLERIVHCRPEGGEIRSAAESRTIRADDECSYGRVRYGTVE